MKKVKSALARKLLKAELKRAQAKAPAGSPLYNAEQKDMVATPKAKKAPKGKVPKAKRPKGGPSPAPLYDAEQKDLTDVKSLSGKPQDKLKGAGFGNGLIQRIRAKRRWQPFRSVEGAYAFRAVQYPKPYTEGHLRKIMFDIQMRLNGAQNFVRMIKSLERSDQSAFDSAVRDIIIKLQDTYDELEEE